MTYSWVRGYAHWGIFANLELQFIGKLESEIFVDMIEPLQIRQMSGTVTCSNVG